MSCDCLPSPVDSDVLSTCYTNLPLPSPLCYAVRSDAQKYFSPSYEYPALIVLHYAFSLFSLYYGLTFFSPKFIYRVLSD